MKELILNELTFENFKGLKSLTIVFNKKVTDIIGDNATGKSSVFDGFTWLLFGKDQFGRTDNGKGRFEIKPLDENNEPIHMLESVVEGKFSIDGQPVVFKRVFQEDWVKPTGEEKQVLKGHSTSFYWNDIPLKKGEYEVKVFEIINESVFKMITNPFAFNELPWLQQREILFTVSGVKLLSDTEIISGNKQFEILLDRIKNVSIQDLIKQNNEIKKKTKENLDAIPIKINEQTKAMPEALDFEAIEKLIQSKRDRVKAIEGEIADSGKAIQSLYDQKAGLVSSLNQKKSRLSELETEARRKFTAKLNEKQDEIKSVENEIIRFEGELKLRQDGLVLFEDQIKNYKGQQSALKEEWSKEAKELVFDDKAFNCPTCSQALPKDDIEAKKAEMTTAFNQKLNSKFKSLSEIGTALSKTITSTQEKIDEYREDIQSLTEIIAVKKEYLNEKRNAPAGVVSVESILAETPEAGIIKNEIQTLSDTIEGFVIDQPDNTRLKEEKTALLSEVEGLVVKLDVRNQIEKCKNRIKEIQDEEKVLAKTLADCNKIEYTIDQFTKYKISMFEEPVNKLFTGVKFKFYNQLVNGGADETCEALVNGVPWKLANNGAKIQSGIEIINKLCEYYQITAPIFIDNRESVTRIPETNSQIINLIVKEGVQKLEVKS